MKLFRFIHVRTEIGRKYAVIGNSEGIISLFLLKCIRLLSMCRETNSEELFLLFMPCNSAAQTFVACHVRPFSLTCAAQYHENCAPSSGTRVARVLSSTCATVILSLSLQIRPILRPRKAHIQALPFSKNSIIVRSSSRLALQPD